MAISTEICTKKLSLFYDEKRSILLGVAETSYATFECYFLAVRTDILWTVVHDFRQL